MKKIFALLFAACCLFATASAQKDIYKFKAQTIDGKTQMLKAYKGKVLLVVNTATACGFTPQYNELQLLYASLQPKGFEILDFPCNQFGDQAPGTHAEIHNSFVERFSITFPQFAKVDVNGPTAHPLWIYLQRQKGFEGFPANDTLSPRLDAMLLKQDANYAQKPDIKWNFTKFLIDRKGRVVRRYEPNHSLKEIEQDIIALMGQQ